MPGVVLEQPEAVGEAETKHPRQRLPFRRRAQDLLAPRRRIVHVAIVRRDVEVAEHDQPRRAREFIREERRHPGQPVQLVFVLVRADGLAVDDVQVDDAQRPFRRRARAAGRRPEDAPLRIVETVDAVLHVVDLAAREDGDAVVRLLS